MIAGVYGVRHGKNLPVEIQQDAVKLFKIMGYGVGTAEALENKVDKQAIEQQSTQRPC